MLFRSSFVTLGGSLIFFSHLTIPSSHCAVLTSHVTILSHIGWFPYFFLTLDDSILTLCSSNITCDSSFSHLVVPLLFSHIWWFPYFFLIFDGFILTFGFNITYDNSSVTLRGSLTFSSHLTVSSSHCAVPTSHVIVLTFFLSHWQFFFHI